MRSTVLTEEILGHGGHEAVTLFMEMSKQLHERGETDALQDWVTIAAPALPEEERNDILVKLMCSYLFLDCQTQAQTGSASASGLH